MSRARAVRIKIKCDGSNYFEKPVNLKGSVVYDSVTLYIDGGDRWPHMTIPQARRLSSWLLEAVEEVERRWSGSYTYEDLQRSKRRHKRRIKELEDNR